MPYFKRRPYAEMMGSRAPNVDGAPASSDQVKPTMSSAERAAAVFEREVRALPEVPTASSAMTGSNVDLEQQRQQARVLLDQLSRVLDAEKSPTSMAEASSAWTPSTVPLLEPPSAVKAGSLAILVLSLENDDRDESIQCTLYSGELMGSQEHRIPARCVAVSPAAVDVPPGGASEVRVSVHVPRETVPGVYAGLLQTAEAEPVRTVLQVRVEA
jgi:hypothetical protein